MTTLARVEDRPAVELLEALDGAAEAALVAPAEPGGRYAFAHALVRDTIIAALPASRRARLHLQIAGVLADRHDAGEVGAGEVVRHLRAGAALAGAERLVTWELAAAREATAALAHADAAAHYEAALAARPGAEDRAEILVALGHARDRAGRREQARAAFAEAAELARAADDPGLFARAALGHGGTAVVIAAADPTAVRLLEEALAAAPARDPATAARLLARLSVELYYADPARARELGRRAVEQARRTDDPAALAAALNAHRVALWSPRHAGERLAVAGDMLAAAEAAGDREAVLQARNWRVVDLLELGQVRETAAEIDAYEALADAVALPHFRWYVPLWRATLALLAGRWDGGRRARAAGARDRAPSRRPERAALRRDPARAPALRPAAHRRDGPRTARRGRRGLARDRRVARLRGAARRRDGGDGGRAPAGLRAHARRLPRARHGHQLARRLHAGRRRRAGSATARRARRCTRCSSRTPRCSRSSPARSAASDPTRPSSGASPACSDATTRPRPGCAARWPRTIAPAPGPRPPSRCCASARRSQSGNAARDVLQQAAQRADALDMPALAADARRLLGPTAG